jgi:hypothetical protein
LDAVVFALLVFEVAERRILSAWTMPEGLHVLSRLRRRQRVTPAPVIAAPSEPPPAAATPAPQAATGDADPLVNALDEAGRRARRRV